MRIAVVHNLRPGGAHRRLGEHLRWLGDDLVEVCLSTAQPITADAEVIGLRPRAPGLPRSLRPPVRYGDLAALLRAWSRAAARVRASGAVVLYANPCRYLQAPAALLAPGPPALYFCDEPRRVDHDPAAASARNRLTAPAYAALYRAERAYDGRAVARARELATNSAFSAGEILRAYGRRAEIVPMGVADAFLAPGGGPGTPAAAGGVSGVDTTASADRPPEPGYVLSVGPLIEVKGHDLVIAGAARAQPQRPVVIVAPRAIPEAAERLLALAESHGVALELRYAISDRALAALFAGAHATVYMAAREPFGLVSLEAQAAGSPVIVADDGGLPETLAPGHAHWAVARDPTTVAARLDELCEPAVRDRAIRAGVEHGARWRWAASAQRVREMLEALCA